MKTTENERKNAHYIIIQSVIIGEDEYVLGKHETKKTRYLELRKQRVLLRALYRRLRTEKSTFIPVVSTK